MSTTYVRPMVKRHVVYPAPNQASVSLTDPFIATPGTRGVQRTRPPRYTQNFTRQRDSRPRRSTFGDNTLP